MYGQRRLGRPVRLGLIVRRVLAQAEELRTSRLVITRFSQEEIQRLKQTPRVGTTHLRQIAQVENEKHRQPRMRAASRCLRPPAFRYFRRVNYWDPSEPGFYARSPT